MIGGGIPINSKAKMMIAGALVVTGTLGTVTAFASTNNSNKSSTTVTGQAGPTVSHHGMSRGGCDSGRIGFRGALNPGSLATILGIDQQTLQSDLKVGQSLVQIAQSKNISEQALISDLQTNYKKQLDAAMSTGKLTSAQEQKMLTNFDNHVKQMVERTGSVFAEHYGSHFGHTTRSKTSSTTSSTTNTTGN